MSLNFSSSLLPTRVHKHEPVVVLDQEAAERQGNAVALVGRNATLPQGFGTTPNMAAAVEPLRTALQCVTPEPAHLEVVVHQEGISNCGLRIADSRAGVQSAIPNPQSAICVAASHAPRSAAPGSRTPAPALARAAPAGRERWRGHPQRRDGVPGSRCRRTPPHGRVRGDEAREPGGG